MPALRYTSAALDNLVDIATYIAQGNGNREVAERFADQIRRKCAHLASLPGTIGRPRPELRADLRSFSFRGYVIFFRYLSTTIEVVSILEGHRDIDSYFRDHAEE